jgi:eukaryotic-like serine/threonine-protein kinase
VVVGERILGRFTIGERLGRGGFGTVHRAWDERLCRSVAVKAIEGPAAGRVMREAHAAARLNHPGIVTLYELGEEAGTTYLVSELVEGPNLRDLAARGAISDREVAEIGVELCAALAHAHGHGVIHRDVKPENVLVRGRPGRRARRMRGSGERALLADFGIASVADEPSLTRTGQLVGTLAYVAPEQAAGESAGPPADAYALALTLYELWTGSNPIAAGSPAATARRIGTELPGLAEARPELPPALCAAIDGALAPDPDERPDLASLRDVLEGDLRLLHPDRPVPEPAVLDQATPLPEAIPLRPFSVLTASGAIAAVGLLSGRPGLAIAAAALLAPAALLLSRPREWIAPALAPLLGAAGLAPLYLIFAASRTRVRERVALAGLGWAWAVTVGAAVGRGLGAPAGTGAEGWAGSGPDALGGLLLPLLATDALAVGLVWIGATILLGAILDVAGSALLALCGLIWTAGMVAALGAIGGAAEPSVLLTPALLAALGWMVWDRAGRPALAPERLLERGNLPPTRSRPARRPRPARVGGTLPDPDARARGTAVRHVRAALHGAGSRAGLP